MNDSMRYNRQMILPEIGEAGQIRLTKARVLVIGAGGLGCPALQYLAGAGIGTIGIIDHDRVDISNLHRQTLFNTNDHGREKVVAAKDHLHALNPEITINVDDAELTDKNAQDLFAQYDLIVDGTDNFPTKFLINDVAVKLKKPVVYGAIQGFDGQVSLFDAAHGPCYRCLYPSPPRGIILNCAEAGVVGALAGIIGTMLAMETIKYFLDHDSFESLSGLLWMIDTKTMETRMITIPKNKECPVCSKEAANIIPHYTSAICSINPAPEIKKQDIPTLPGAIMIDVREPEEWKQGHIKGAIHFPLSTLTANPEIFSPYRESICVIYCQHGMRSMTAANILLKAGFIGIYSLKGGYAAWKETEDY